MDKGSAQLEEEAMNFESLMEDDLLNILGEDK